MSCSVHRALASVTVFILMANASPGLAGTSDQSIGLFTTVQGQVSVTHPGQAQVLPVNVRDDVYFKDVIETRDKSRTKAFFDDETILTVGENSRVTVTEHIYNPDLDVRRVVINLLLGKLRALVGKAFTGSGSKFEIHTPTAVAAARGTYFVVWVDPSGSSGIANIGEAGNVDFTSGGRTITVAPGEYSVAKADQAPAMPAVYQNGPKTALHALPGGGAMAARGTVDGLTGRLGTTIESTLGLATDALGLATDALGVAVDGVTALGASAADIPAEALDAIEGTTLLDAPPVESPQQVVQALGLNTVAALPTTVAGRSISLRASGSAPDAASSLGAMNTAVTQVVSGPSVVSGALATSVGAVGAVGGAVGSLGSVVSTIPVTPPAVTSGATEGLGLPLP